MEQKCHDITLAFLNNGESVCKEIEFNPEASHEIKNMIVKLYVHQRLSMAMTNGQVCSNMDEFEQDEKNRKALTLSEINGNDCPVLHICDNKHDLFEIIMSFLNTGFMYSGVNWLRSE